nr:hypothetical protein [Tanacetum cinerariifolium]
MSFPHLISFPPTPPLHNRPPPPNSSKPHQHRNPPPNLSTTECCHHSIFSRHKFLSSEMRSPPGFAARNEVAVRNCYHHIYCCTKKILPLPP